MMRGYYLFIIFHPFILKESQDERYEFKKRFIQTRSIASG